MDLETPLHTECKVSGTLSFLLCISRLAGLAPLKFRKTTDGWCIQVSEAANLYGIAVVALFVTVPVGALILDLTVYKGSLSYMTNATLVIWILDVLTVAAVIIIAAYTGINRMRYMIDCLVELEQINEELIHFREPTPKSDRTKLIVVSSLIFGLLLVASDYCYYLTKAITTNGNVTTSSLYIFCSISFINLYMLVLQFLLITTRILCALRELNYCFENVLKDLKKNKSVISTFSILYYNTINMKDTPIIKSNQVAQKLTDDMAAREICDVPRRLNRLVRIYEHITDIIHKIERSHGFLLVMLFVSFLLHLVITMYHMIYGITHPIRDDDELMNTILQLPWIIYQSSKLVMVVEPCHRTHDQLRNTKNLISHMMRYTRYDDFATIAEIRTFFRYLSLNEGRYSPMQLFTLNRSIMVTMLGSITTYLIIVIQIK